MRSDKAVFRVGVLVLAALAVLATGIFLIGERSQLFRPKNQYLVLLESAEGLAPGNPVQMSGVKVGRVDSVVLAEDPNQPNLVVTLSLDRRYAPRVRTDSKARLRTVGLLGDKYVDLEPGSATAPPIADGGVIPAPPQADLTELMGSGQDLLSSVTQIASQMTRLLDRVEHGEGLIGALLAEPSTAEPSLAESLQATMRSFQTVASDLEEGKGTVGRLLKDPGAAERLESSLERLEGVLAQAESGEGLMPALLNDATMRQRLDASLANLERTSAHLEGVISRLEDGDGLLPKLLNDEEYANKVSGELQQLLERLNKTVARVSEGDGTVAQLINDPSIYQAFNDIVVGINDSKILRWLIRNRQRAGIKHRILEEGLPPDAEPGGP